MTLYNYSKPRYAATMLRKLKEWWPRMTFEVVQSPLAAYPFRYLIQAKTPDGKIGYAGKRKYKLPGE